MTLDHPIFSASIRQIRLLLAEKAELLAGLTPLERDVLERCIHSSGDPAIAADLRFSPGACAAGAAALAAGTPILTDTAMAAAAVAPMARRTFGNRVTCVLDWAPAAAPEGSTRTAAGMAAALAELAPGAVVLIGSAPTALEVLLEQVAGGGPAPALVIGMPVGFVGVAESKRHLAASGLVHIGLEGSKGGAGLVAAACNALLRSAWLAAAHAPSPVR
ncbi:MAG: precorrin-8X methylmutase [Cyanobium sp.]